MEPGRIEVGRALDHEIGMPSHLRSRCRQVCGGAFLEWMNLEWSRAILSQNRPANYPRGLFGVVESKNI